MSCVLRITSEALSARLPSLSIRPYRFEKDTAHFQVSKCDFDDLPGQVREAAAYLISNRAELASLMSAPAASAVLDFAVEVVASEFRFARLPAHLVREAGSLGLGLEISQYPSGDVSC
jgi:hypothetical protein